MKRRTKENAKHFFAKSKILILYTNFNKLLLLRICAFGIVKVCYKEQKARGWPAKVKCEKQKSRKLKSAPDFHLISGF